MKLIFDIDKEDISALIVLLKPTPEDKRCFVTTSTATMKSRFPPKCSKTATVLK